MDQTIAGLIQRLSRNDVQGAISTVYATVASDLQASGGSKYIYIVDARTDTFSSRAADKKTNQKLWDTTLDILDLPKK